MRELRSRKFIKIDLILSSFLVIVFAGLIMFLYEQSTNWVYFWDNAAYWNQVYDLSTSYRLGFNQTVETIRNQINTEYPTWWALPFALVPPSLLSSRGGFTVPLASISVLVIFLSSYLIQSQYGIKKQARLLSSFALAFSPPVWIILSSSHPDLLSLSLVFFAIHVTLRGKGELVSGATAFLLIFLAIAMRKTVAFAAFATIIFVLIYFFKNSSRQRQVWTKKKTAVLSVIFLSYILIFLMSPGVVSTFTRNNSDFYRSWKISTGTVISRLVETNGILILALSFICIILYLIHGGNWKKIENYWMIILPVVVFSAYITIAPGVAPVHMAQLGVLLLLAATITISKLQIRYQSLVAIIMLASTTLLTFQSMTGNLSLPGKFLSMNISPLQRNDIDELIKIKAILGSKENFSRLPNVYVAGTSGVVNPDLVTRLVRPEFSVVPAGDVDFRDAIQWPLITSSNYILVPKPFQWHITENSHKIVQVPFELFTNEFQGNLLPITSLSLLNGVNLQIFAWRIPLNSTELEYAQEKLIRALPTYSIPTILATKFPYFQPSPGSQKRIWFRLGFKNDPTLIWVPKNLKVTLRPLDPQCRQMSSFPNLADELEDQKSFLNKDESTTLKLFRSSPNNVSCDYELVWGG
jgi:hypothetical protein